MSGRAGVSPRTAGETARRRFVASLMLAVLACGEAAPAPRDGERAAVRALAADGRGAELVAAMERGLARRDAWCTPSFVLELEGEAPRHAGWAVDVLDRAAEAFPEHAAAFADRRDARLADWDGSVCPDCDLSAGLAYRPDGDCDVLRSCRRWPGRRVAWP